MSRPGRRKSRFGKTNELTPEMIRAQESKEIEKDAQKTVDGADNSEEAKKEAPKLDRDALLAEFKDKVEALNRLLTENAAKNTELNTKKAARVAATAKVRCETARLEAALQQKKYEDLTGFVKELGDVKTALGTIVSDLESLENADDMTGFIQGLAITRDNLDTILNDNQSIPKPETDDAQTPVATENDPTVTASLIDVGAAENMDAVVLTTEIKKIDEKTDIARKEAEQTAKKLEQVAALIANLNVKRDLELLQKEYEEKQKMALKSIAKQTITGIADNLERSVDILSNQQESLGSVFNSVAQRLEKATEELQQVFEIYGIKKIPTQVGTIRDPNVHQEIAMAPVPGKAKGEILEVQESGYTLNGINLRPSKVVVATGQ